MDIKILKNNLILLCGLIFVFLISIINIKNDDFNSISNPYPTNSISHITHNEYLVFSGTFVAKDNHFGILEIPFKGVPNSRTEEVIFQIQEANSSTILHENRFPINYLLYFEYFPIGLPIVSNSKGKTYSFKIFIPKKDAKIISIKKDDNYYAKHFFSIKDVSSNPLIFINLLQNKLYIAINDPITIRNAILISLLYILFLIYYVTSLKTKIVLSLFEINKSPIGIIITFTIFITTLIYNVEVNVILLIITAQWYIFRKYYNDNYIDAMQLSITFFSIALFSTLFNLNLLDEKFSILAFLFFIIGLIECLLIQFPNFKLTTKYEK
jgi:hypothetical protein